MEGLFPRFELDTPRVNLEAPIGLIKKTSTRVTLLVRVGCILARKSTGFRRGGFQYGVFRISVRIPNFAMVLVVTPTVPISVSVSVSVSVPVVAFPLA